MKRIIIIAAAFAALSACTKTETETVNVTGPSVGTAFEKGQTVTLNVNAGTTTKVTSELNADGQTVDFKWAAEDKIKVTVSGKDAEFTLKSGAGGSSAVFEGVMPASGTTFDVQYPVDPPVLSEQTYSSTEAIPHDKMLFSAKNCSIADGSFTLTAQNAALRLNLYGSKPIGKIVVSDGGENPKTYTLTCGDPGTGITLGATDKEPTPFFIVVPFGSMKFTAKVFDNALTPESICKFEPSAAQDFSPAKVLNMPAKEVKYYPLSGVFSVSSTDKIRFSQGNLRAKKEGETWTWGFYGNQYDCASEYESSVISLFTWGYGSWSTIPNTKDYGSSFTDWGTKVGDGKTWRTLSGGEWTYLLSTRTVNGGNGEGKSYQRATVSEVFGLIIYPDDYKAQTGGNSYTSADWATMESAGCVFLPAAGFRYGSKVNNVGSNGYYWSSTAYSIYDVEGAYGPRFSSEFFHTAYSDEFDSSNSVRLVCDTQ